MSGQILFFKKNKADLDNADVIASASEGSLYASRVLNRSNNDGWATTGSVDANNTTLTIDMVDSFILTDIFLLKHNFKSFTVKYWNGSAYVDFSPAIGPTSNTDTSNRFSFAQVTTSKVQLTVLGTQVANSDKVLSQFILTQLLGQLNGWPAIKRPTFDRNLRNNKMLSGKLYISENVGSFSCDLHVDPWTDNSDLTIVETLYASNDGFLTWLSGGNPSQFSSIRKGYRFEDLFLMKCVNPYIPEWHNGLYTTGLNLTISLSEVTV